MKKQIIYRGLLGLPLGIAVGFIIALVISMCINDGRFYPVQPELMERMGSEPVSYTHLTLPTKA